MPARSDAQAQEGKRRLLLQAAVRVFARKGYHASRISDIAEEAGVAYGLLYHYFDSKEEVLRNVFRETWRALIATIKSVEEGSDPPRELRRLPAAAPRDGLRRLRAVQDHVLGPLTDAHPGARFVLDLGRTHAVGYYRGLQLSIGALSDRGAPTELVDGGSTDWTAMLLSDRKERLFTSGIGLDRLAAGRA